MSKRIVAPGSLSTERRHVRQLPELPTYPTVVATVERRQPHVDHMNPSPKIPPILKGLDMAAKVVNKMTEVQDGINRMTAEVAAVDRTTDSFLAAVWWYCTATPRPSASSPVYEYLEGLANYEPDWARVLDSIPNPGWQPYARRSDDSRKEYLDRVAREANVYIAVQREFARRVHAFARDRYRAIPAKPELYDVRGWFKWSISSTFQSQADKVAAYCNAVEEFRRPRRGYVDKIPAGGQALNEALAALGAAAADLSELATLAKVHKPREFGPTSDAKLQLARDAIAQVDQVLRELVVDDAV